MSIDSTRPTAAWHAEQLVTAIECGFGSSSVAASFEAMIQSLGGRPDLAAGMSPHSLVAYVSALIVQAAR